MAEYTILSRSTTETEDAGRQLASRLRGVCFVALYGDLGAGKTAFVRGMASVLAPSSHVCSPTYTLVNEYTSGDVPLYHFDLYRITDEDDLYSTGFYDYLSEGICVCEWSENIPWAIPPDSICVRLDKVDEECDMRIITVTGEI